MCLNSVTVNARDAIRARLSMCQRDDNHHGSHSGHDYAITINKSQDQTLKKVCFDVRDHPFAHAQTSVYADSSSV